MTTICYCNCWIIWYKICNIWTLLESVYLITLLIFHFVDDPEACKIVDCSQENIIDVCPKTCKDAAILQKICAAADCTKHESLHLCPNKCGAGIEYNHQNLCKFKSVYGTYLT